jgi:ankyrin repeat protein
MAPTWSGRGPGDTPFLGAIGWSHVEAAAAMLACGANVNAQNDRGMTAAHMMLKKGSAYEHFELLARYGARFDLPNKDGVTAAEIMSRKRDPKFRSLTSITGKKGGVN